MDGETPTDGEEEAAVAESFEQKRMEWTAVKGRGLRTVESVAEGEGLDVAEGEELGDFQPKAWGHSTLQTTRRLLPQMALGRNQRFGRLVRMMQMMELSQPRVDIILLRTCQIIVDSKEHGRIR